MNRYEKALVWLLRIDGVVMLSALIPAIMPFGWMQQIHRYLGLGELPDLPITGYLTRSLSLMYALYGAVVLFLSTDVRRFLPVVKVLAVLTILLGVGLTVLDVAAGMPAFWIIAEGPGLFVLYCVVLWRTGHHAIVLAEPAQLGMQFRLVPVRLGDRRPQVVDHQGLDAAAEMMKRVFQAADELLDGLAEHRLAVSFAAVAKDDAKDVRLATPALAVHDGRAAAEIHLGLFAGLAFHAAKGQLAGLTQPPTYGVRSMYCRSPASSS